MTKNSIRDRYKSVWLENNAMIFEYAVNIKERVVKLKRMIQYILICSVYLHNSNWIKIRSLNSWSAIFISCD